jgi:hypothetical protein
MSKEYQNENGSGSSQPDYPQDEPLYPGWQPLNKVANFTEPFFDAPHFLLSNEYHSYEK